MKAILNTFYMIVISPFAILGLIMWILLLWNYETANGVSDWAALKKVFTRIDKL